MIDDVEALPTDENAFAALVRTHSSALLRLAEAHIADRSVAEEIVQETWLALLRDGIPGGRVNLRVRLSAVLLELIRERAGAEPSLEPLPEADDDDGTATPQPAVDPRRFQTDGIDTGHWVAFPHGWHAHPEEVLLAGEVREVALRTMADLHPMQRDVIALRDVEGWDSDEVAEALDISPGNQRVLLHRARAKVRAELERYYDGIAR